MSYHYNAIPHFRERFDCPSYTSITNLVYHILASFKTWVLKLREDASVAPKHEMVILLRMLYVHYVGFIHSAFCLTTGPQPLSTPSILSFPLSHPVAAYVLFPVFASFLSFPTVSLQ